MQTSDKNMQRRGLLAAIGANAIFGFSFMASRIALNSLSSATMLMLRFLSAFVFVNLLVLFLSRKKNVPAWLQFHLKGKSILPLLALGLCEPIFYFFCETNGIRMTNSSISGVLIATIPIFSMLTGFLFLHERVRPLQIVFAVVSIAGIILLTTGQTDSGAIRPLGILFLMGAVLSGSLFNVVSRSISGRYTPLESTYVMMGLGAFVFGSVALVQGIDLRPALQPGVILSIGYLALISSILAFLLLNYANSILPVARTTAFCNLTTVLSLFAGVVFLGEPFSFAILGASLLIILGIIGVQKFAE